MANALNGNTLYVDSTGDLTTVPTKVQYVVVTATAANAIIALQDTTSNQLKLNLRVATSGESQLFDFSANPVYFPTGVEVGTLTNAIATVVYSK